MTKVTQTGASGKERGGDRHVDPSAYRRVMILADRPALFNPDVAELAELAKGLGPKIEIERFDLEENKFTGFVL